MTALNALSKAANDAQQRGWALHDDAHDIQTQLLELISVMVRDLRYIISCWQYQASIEVFNQFIVSHELLLPLQMVDCHFVSPEWFYGCRLNLANIKQSRSTYMFLYTD